MLRDSGSENGAGAAVGLGERVAVGAGAAPELGRSCGSGPRRSRPGRPRTVHERGGGLADAAVLAPVLAPAVLTMYTVSSVASSLPSAEPTLREPLKPSGLTIGTTRLRLCRTMPRRARVAGLVAVDQLVGPLHRVLARRPLARVVDAHVQERRLAVVERDVLGDLDARAPRGPSRSCSGSVNSRTKPGFCGGERLQLGLVVGQLCGSSCGRSGASVATTGARRLCARPAAATRSSTSTRQLKPAARSVASSVGAVEHDAERGRCRRARSGRGRARPGGPCPRAWACCTRDELGRVRPAPPRRPPPAARARPTARRRRCRCAGRPARSASRARASSPCAISCPSGEAPPATS